MQCCLVADGMYDARKTLITNFGLLCHEDDSTVVSEQEKLCAVGTARLMTRSYNGDTSSILDL